MGPPRQIPVEAKGIPPTDNSNPEAYPSSYPGRRILTLLIRYPSRGTAVRDGMRQDLAILVLLLQPYSPRMESRGSKGKCGKFSRGTWCELERKRREPRKGFGAAIPGQAARYRPGSEFAGS